ncbi:MAG: lipoyl(octanoyl) transferase LipB [Candidatus Omnitrophica bacterium]|nr:lipoyl(octanoyl) transferase LipB [Candidatus Omnitrophota bacterium]
MDHFTVEDWGLIDHRAAVERQRALVREVIAGAPQRLVFCEHPPVLTLGRMFKPDSFLYTRQDILSQGVSIVPVDRGGDVTLHAPGQLIVYVVADLNRYGRDLKAYLEHIEQVAVDLLKDFDILAMSMPGQRGVFVPTLRSGSSINGNKIVSIGVGVRRWVTYHGLGINVNTDLSLFDLIKPCGLDVRMTSIAQWKGAPVSMGDVKEKFTRHFNRRFN